MIDPRPLAATRSARRRRVPRRGTPWRQAGALAAIGLVCAAPVCSPEPSTLPPQPTANTYEERAVQRVGQRLRDAGITFDASKIVVEVKRREEIGPDLDARLDLGLRPKHLPTLWQLRGILEATPSIRSVEDLRAQAVAARTPDTRVYYANDRRAMVFVGAEARDDTELEVALAGELVFVFYEQGPGGLAETLYEPKGLLDGVRVRKCLIEGHARLAELLVRYGSLDALDADALAQLDPEPAHLHASLTETRCGPGARYLYERYREGKWSAVLKAARNPVPSTEQLMHAAKVGQDFPVNVALPDWPEDEYDSPAPLGPAKLVYEDVLGELTIERLLRERGVERTTARLAAIGWDGDRLRIYEHSSGDTVMVWRSVWDREVDAEQFAAAVAPKGIDARAFRVERHGRVVDAVSCPDPSMADRLHVTLSARPAEPTAQPSDGASTAAIEARVAG